MKYYVAAFLSLFVFSTSTAQSHLPLGYSDVYKPHPEAQQFLSESTQIFCSNDGNKDSVLAAVQLLDKAIQADDKYYYAYWQKANFLAVNGYYAEALSTVKQMELMRPGYAELLSYEGILYYKLGKSKKAQAKFKKTYHIYESVVDTIKILNVSYAKAIANKGLLLMLIGRNEKGSELIKNTYAEHRNNHSVNCNALSLAIHHYCGKSREQLIDILINERHLRVHNSSISY